MKKTSASHHGSLSELNITPLLDLVFVLLVIFIITTPQMMNNLDINLPNGKKPPPDQKKPKFASIVVDANGNITLDNHLVTIGQLKSELKARQDASADPDIPVVVNGDDNVNYQSMISVIDVIKQLNITKMGLATQ